MDRFVAARVCQTESERRLNRLHSGHAAPTSQLSRDNRVIRDTRILLLAGVQIPCSIGHIGLAGKFEEVLRARRTFQGMLLKLVIGDGSGLQRAGGIGDVLKVV